MEKSHDSTTETISQWYLDLVIKAQLVEYSPVRGCIILRPKGYALWERIQSLLDEKIKALGHQNVYFPLLIPYSFFLKEARHVEGFAPELGMVTHVGEQKLEDPLVLRPTSETIIWHTLRSWLHSYRDLPMKFNQWANVIRFEKRTRPFLRTTEFLWQEGHTLHIQHQEAKKHALTMLAVYKDFLEQDMAIPVYDGVKTASEQFAGANETYSVEIMAQDKKAIQAGTSHDLGQNFSRAFEVRYQDSSGKEEYPFATSWGVSTRLIGALILVHGDARGLMFPPRIAPFQLVIMPIIKEQTSGERVEQMAYHLAKFLKPHFRLYIDQHNHRSPGWRFAQAELEGVPLRLDLGVKELDQGEVTLFRRDKRTKVSVPLPKSEVDFPQFIQTLQEYLDDIQNSCWTKAKDFREKHTFTPSTYAQLLSFYEKGGGFVKMQWCGSTVCEQTLKDATKATIRCIPFVFQKIQLECCLICQQRSRHVVLVAKAY